MENKLELLTSQIQSSTYKITKQRETQSFEKNELDR